MTSNATGQPPPGWHPPLPERLPKPTAYPAVVGFGACLLAWGLVTSWAISAVGMAVFAVGIGGWVKEMLDERRS